MIYWDGNYATFTIYMQCLINQLTNLFVTQKAASFIFVYTVLPHYKSVAELKVPVFQAALTVHDIDADSARGTSVITDDKCSCWFSDNEEVSECVDNHSGYVNENECAVCTKEFVFCCLLVMSMPALQYMHISFAEEVDYLLLMLIIHLCCLHDAHKFT